METTVSPLLFIALVPHRDCLSVLEAYRRSLFAAGLNGAFAFPAVAPLALLKRPLETAELKNAATELRKKLENRKIMSIGCSEYDAGIGFPNTPDGIRFFGAVLDMPLPAFPSGAVLRVFERLILAPAILVSGESSAAVNHSKPNISFRAAALANLALQPACMANPEETIKDCSFAWDLGPLHWLPHYKRNNRE